MLKALIYKQFTECFRSYFVNRKTQKANPPAKIIFYFVLFAVLLSFLCALGFGMSWMLQNALSSLPQDMHWVYWALMGAGAVIFGVFGSVFNTYASLYLPKDNEFLLSMPIRPGQILVSRLVMVYLLSLIYSGAVWLPAVLGSIIFGQPSALSIVFSMLLLFVVALLVTVITCVLGWVVALVASRLRSKSIIMVILATGFFLLYEYVCINLGDIMQMLTDNLMQISRGVEQYAGFLYVLGQAGDGQVLWMLLFCGITIGAAALCYAVMRANYGKLLLRNASSIKKTAVLREEKTRSLGAALFMREARRLGASTAYMLNGCFGSVLMPIAAIAMLVNRGKIVEMLPMAGSYIPNLPLLFPVAVPAMVLLIVFMNCVSLPSVSLEGKNLWILQTMPIPAYRILRAKRDLHIAVNLLPSFFLAIVMDVCVGCCSLTVVLLQLLLLFLAIVFGADLGLFFGIRHADLKWTSETVVIKQNIFVLVMMIIGLLLAAAIGASGWFAVPHMDVQLFLSAWCLIVFNLVLLLEKWLRTKGSKQFCELQ